MYIPLLALIVLILILSSKENTNYKVVKIFTFLLGFLIIIFSETTANFISKNLFQNFYLLIIPIFGFISVYILFLKKLTFKLK